MKLKSMVLFTAIWMLLFSGTSMATVYLYVDAAPNIYGSPDYSTWRDSTYAAVASGTFQNMSSSINPGNVGTTNFEIQDEVVYSFGDLGSRLTWIYWIPETTVGSLDGRFQISLLNNWGDDPTLDFYDYYYHSTWLQPTSWTDYNGGVIGVAGMAWWGAYGVDTQDALMADINDWMTVSETWTFTAMLDCETASIVSHREAEAPVPEPTTMFLLGAGLVGLVGARKKLRN